MIIVNSIVTFAFCYRKLSLNAQGVDLFSIFCMRCYIHLCLFATSSIVFVLLKLSHQYCWLRLYKQLDNQLGICVINPTFSHCCCCMLKLLICQSMLLFISKRSFLMFAYSVRLRGAATCLNNFELCLLPEYYYSSYNALSREPL